jgi:MFS family permease
VSPLRGLWLHPSFRRLWAGQSISLFGMQFGFVAFPLVAIITLDADAAQVGLISTFSLIPWFLLGPFAGGLVARVPRRTMVIMCHVTRAAVIALVPALAVTQTLSLPWLYAVALINGAFSVLFEVAYHTYLPELVDADSLDEGNSKLAVTDGLARATGPAFGGAAVQLITAPLALVVQALSYAIAAVSIMLIPPSQTAGGSAAERPASSGRGGWARLTGDRTLRGMIMVEIGYLFGFAFVSVALAVFYVREVGLSPFAIGAVFAVGSIGGTLAGLVTPRLRARAGDRPSLVLGGTLRVLGLALIPLAALAGPAGFAVAAAARGVNAFGWTTWEVRWWSTQQRLTPEDHRAATTGATVFAIRIAETLGTVAGTALAVVLAPGTLVVIGTVVGAVSLLALGWLRRPGKSATTVR